MIMLGALAVLLVLAGLLPWLVGGSGAARGFATPLLLVGVFAGYAVLRAGRTGPAAPRRPVSGPASGSASGSTDRCGGCRCGAGGCRDDAQQPAP
jgi:hypothetical protein